MNLRTLKSRLDLTPERAAVVSARRYRSPLRYPGGKQKALAAIAGMLPASAREYREPMVGGGSVYLLSRSLNLCERYWINDKFEDLACFWSIVQDEESCRRLVDDLEALRNSFSSVAEIKDYFQAARREQGTDPYRRALLFFFFNRVTFSGTTRAGGFSAAASLKRFTLSSINRLARMPEALAATRVTSLDYEEVITADGDDVFLFLDPPYYTATRLYGHNGSLHAFDHERLAGLLRNTRHRFLLTYDDCPEVRRLYRWANISQWSLQYGMNNCNLKRQSKVGAELFVSNYSCP